MSIGSKIYELRKKKNLSQEELGAVLNVSRQTISKWELGESNPDFDKIVPLCDFFSISTDELLKGNKPNLEKEFVRVSKKNKALTISLCIFIFIIMTVLIVALEEIGVNEAVIASITLISIGAIAIILVYYFLSKPLQEIKIEDSNTDKRSRLIDSIINLLIIIIYIVISIIFGWTYTWIILIIGLLIKKVIQLVLLLRSDKDEK